MLVSTPNPPPLPAARDLDSSSVVAAPRAPGADGLAAVFPLAGSSADFSVGGPETYVHAGPVLRQNGAFVPGQPPGR